MSSGKTGSAVRPAPRLRRAYYECRYGQLHLHNAIPAGGGFDELTALVCIPGSGMTGRAFQSVLAELGYDRSVYAPDMPGTGESDPSGDEPPVEAALAALQDFLDTMRLREVDLLALADGGQIARRLAEKRPRGVRRVVLLAETGPGGPAVAQPMLALSQDEAHGPRRNSRIAEFLG
ncbi:MAG: alpha/beta fold hydrolase [Steroidobacteraceae bacterium]